MSRSHSSTVIDLTEESPPARSRPRPPTLGADTHILDWASDSRADRASSHSVPPNAASSSGTSSSRLAAAPIVVGSDDEDDDNSFTITRISEPVRTSHPPQRPLSMAATPTTSSVFHRASSGPTVTASSVRFHDGIGRGPHGAGSHIRPSVDAHPLLPRRRPAIPSASANASRRSGAGATTGTDAASAAASFASRLGGDSFLGRLGFGTTYSMEIISSLLRGLQSGVVAEPQQSSQRKVPQEYDPKWTHSYDAQPGFTHNIIEPPVDLDTYFDDKAVVTGPLPETTPICPCCRHALVTGANRDERIWVLPCGHVIDGRCLDQLSGLTLPPSVAQADVHGTPRMGKGKAKASEAAEDEPPAKVARISARTRAAATTIAEPKESTLKKPKKPKRFDCPVQGCGQKCTKESNKKDSAWEVFV